MSLHPASPGSPTTSRSPRRCTVLVIDDHHDTLDMLRLMLTRQGHAVLTCDCCAGARAAAADADAAGTKLDLVIGDIGLPDGDGVALMCELKIKLGCPAIALTGQGTAEDVRRCEDAGIDRHLLKPVGVRQLGQVMKDLADC